MFVIRLRQLSSLKVFSQRCELAWIEFLRLFFVFAYYLGYMRIRLQSLIIILVISISEFL